MGSWSRTPHKICSIQASCSVCRLHARIGQQIDIFSSNHPDYWASFSTIGRYHSSTLPPVLKGQNSCILWLYQRFDGTVIPSQRTGHHPPAKQAAPQHQTSCEVTWSTASEPHSGIVEGFSHGSLGGANPGRECSPHNQTSGTKLCCQCPTRNLANLPAESGRDLKREWSFQLAYCITSHRTWFSLHKGAFRDALCLCYGWTPTTTMHPYACATKLSMSSMHWAVPMVAFHRSTTVRSEILQHISWVKTAIMSEQNQCYNQSWTKDWPTEPPINIEDGARIIIDIKAQGFWRRAKEEMRKKREGHTTNEWEKLSKVVFCLWYLYIRRYGPNCQVVCKRLASMIATKHNQRYSQSLNWLCCGLTFSLLCSVIMCLRGSRSSANNPAPRSYTKLSSIAPSAIAEWPPDSDKQSLNPTHPFVSIFYLLLYVCCTYIVYMREYNRLCWWVMHFNLLVHLYYNSRYSLTDYMYRFISSTTMLSYRWHNNNNIIVLAWHKTALIVC